ncbi:MAG: TetR/AcrR family transcriptional regulator [Acetobacteraceae bacterium]
MRAGVRAMHAQGYAATGVQSILEEAHVPKGTFYNHFESKEAFGAEVLDAYSQSGQDKLRVFLGNRDIAPLARLEAYFDDRIEAFRASDFNRGCLLGNFSAEAADHSAVIRQHLQKHFAGWSDIFETASPMLRRRGLWTRRFQRTCWRDSSSTVGKALSSACAP